MSLNFPEKIQVGISQCLLGDNVRYDGSHKHSKICTERLAKHFDFTAVCPETGIGMSVPRDAIHLRGSLYNDVVRAVGKHTAGLDVTEALETYGREKAHELHYLCGYIFMGRSPSCGLSGIKVHHESGNPIGRSTQGIYAREFTQHHLLMPVEEEGLLRDDKLLENFVGRVYAFRRWRDLVDSGLTRATLQDFHARHKYLLMSHRNESYRHLGRLVALAHQRDIAVVAKEYVHEFMMTLKIVSTKKTHANVLQHLMGYLKKGLDTTSKQELLKLLDDYRCGRVPLIAPLTLLKHHLQKNPNAYLQRQFYLEPHPPELMLRNFI